MLLANSNIESSNYSNDFFSAYGTFDNRVFGAPRTHYSMTAFQKYCIYFPRITYLTVFIVFLLLSQQITQFLYLSLHNHCLLPKFLDAFIIG